MPDHQDEFEKLRPLLDALTEAERAEVKAYLQAKVDAVDNETLRKAAAKTEPES